MINQLPTLFISDAIAYCTKNRVVRLQDSRLSERWSWRVLSSWMKRRRMVRWNSTDVSEEHVASSKPARNQDEAGSKFAAYFILASCFAYSSTLKMEVTYSSETSVAFQRITRRYIPYVIVQVVKLPVKNGAAVHSLLSTILQRKAGRIIWRTRPRVLWKLKTFAWSSLLLVLTHWWSWALL
jgi:hypothetical protein